jgi:hypothetical protein
MVFNKSCTLNKHTTGTTGWIIDSSLVRFDDFSDEFNDRSGSEELPSFLPLAHSKLAKKIFVYLSGKYLFFRNIKNNFYNEF